jgi:hypothetical protein
MLLAEYRGLRSGQRSSASPTFISVSRAQPRRSRPCSASYLRAKKKKADRKVLHPVWSRKLSLPKSHLSLAVCSPVLRVTCVCRKMCKPEEGYRPTVWSRGSVFRIVFDLPGTRVRLASRIPLDPRDCQARERAWRGGTLQALCHAQASPKHFAIQNGDSINAQRQSPRMEVAWKNLALDAAIWPRVLERLVHFRLNLGRNTRRQLPR